MKRVVKVLEDEDWGWKKWIKIEGDEGVSRFKKEIVDWLYSPIEWGEDMLGRADARGSAKCLFEYQEDATLDALGVSILEFSPSQFSSWKAAVLEKNVEEANAIAQKLGLWYRFQPAMPLPGQIAK
jgi:hypothetical protein